MNEPRLRFKGFNEHWETNRIGNLGTVKAGGDVDKTKLVKNGNYPVIANGLVNNGIIGYYENYYKISGNSVTITGRGNIGVAKSRNYKYTPVVRLLVFKSNLDINFSELAINNIHIFNESTGVPQLTSLQLKTYKISFPPLDEQHKIGSFFSDLDRQIELQSNKLKALKRAKKGYLQRMFPSDDSNEPKLRLKGFSDKWKTIELKNISELSQGVVGDAMLNDGKYKITRIESISTGKINVKKLGFINEKPQDRYLLKNGDILFSNINSMRYIGNNAIFDLDKEIYHGTNLLRIRPLNVEPYFLYYELNTDFHTNWAKKHANPAVSQASINKTTLGEQPIKIPNSYNEQKMIGLFLNNLDKQIELQQIKLINLKKQKKAYLQKMFI